MNSQKWIEYYEQNRKNRQEPDWARPCPLPQSKRAELARSLAHFQLGESGGGRCLYRLGQAVSTTSNDSHYPDALDLFLAEEKEHARLLARLVEWLDGDIITRHWTHRLFRLVRQAAGLHFEVQVLVTAELAGTAYYEIVRDRAGDETVKSTIDLLLRDEARHVEFHAERLSEWLGSLLPIERSLWETQFQVLFIKALWILWLDHGRCLRKLGSDRRELFERARRHTIHFLARVRLTPESTHVSPSLSPT